MAKKTTIRAIEDYTAAIAAEPTSILAHVNRAIAWQSTNDYDKAVADYNEAIRLGLKTAAAYNNRGGAHKTLGALDKALTDFERAIALNPAFEALLGQQREERTSIADGYQMLEAILEKAGK